MEIYEQGKNKNKKTEKLRQYFDDVSDNPDVDNDDDYYSEDEYEEEFNNNYQSIELPILTKRKAIVKSIETHEITVIDGETGKFLCFVVCMCVCVCICLRFLIQKKKFSFQVAEKVLKYHNSLQMISESQS